MEDQALSELRRLRVAPSFDALGGTRSERERAPDMGRAAQQHERGDRQAEAAGRAVARYADEQLDHRAPRHAGRWQRDLAPADAQMNKAWLRLPTKPAPHDPNIAAAMAVAAGKPLAPHSSSERLTALKAGSAMGHDSAQRTRPRIVRQ